MTDGLQFSTLQFSKQAAKTANVGGEAELQGTYP